MTFRVKFLVLALVALILSAMASGAVQSQNSRVKRTSPAKCSSPNCLVVSHVDACEGPNCLEAKRKLKCNTPDCYTLEQVASCESPNCFTLTTAEREEARRRAESALKEAQLRQSKKSDAEKEAEKQARASRNAGRQGNAENSQSEAAEDADEAMSPEKESNGPAFKRVTKCLGPGCFIFRTARNCKTGLCFEAVPVKKCPTAPDCFASTPGRSN